MWICDQPDSRSCHQVLSAYRYILLSIVDSVLFFFFHRCLKHYNHGTLGEKTFLFLFGLHIPFQFISEECYSRKSVRSWDWNQGRQLLTDVLPGSYSATNLLPPRTTCSGVRHPGPSHKNQQSRKCPTDIPLGQFDDINPVGEIPFSEIYLGFCQVAKPR